MLCGLEAQGNANIKCRNSRVWPELALSLPKEWPCHVLVAALPRYKPLAVFTRWVRQGCYSIAFHAGVGMRLNLGQPTSR